MSSPHVLNGSNCFKLRFDFNNCNKTKRDFFQLLKQNAQVLFLFLWAIPWLRKPGAYTSIQVIVGRNQRKSSSSQWVGTTGELCWQACFLWLMLSLFSCTTQDWLLRSGRAHSGLGPLPPIFNQQDNSPQIWPQVNLI